MRDSLGDNRCWTCKRRKVKCDERSSGCGNCEKMKIPCEGYGIKLQWINVSNPFLEKEKPGSSSSGRGRIRIGRIPISSNYLLYPFCPHVLVLVADAHSVCPM